jgi:hypothetical protein
VRREGTEHANNPMRYWVDLRNHYPNLSKLTLTYSLQRQDVSVSACLVSLATC